MSPSTKPVRNVKVQVPRHNSQRIGPGVTACVEKLAHEQHTRVDVRQTAYESSSALAQAIDSASEWNSLLLTARAERGPQWDIGTQQFLVEEYSDLYYDPSPLLEYQKEARTSGEGEDGPSSGAAPNERQVQDIPSTPKNIISRTPSHQSPGMHTPLHNPPPFFANNAPQSMASPRHPFSSPGQVMGGQGIGPQGMSVQGMGGQGMGFGGMNMNVNMNMGNLGMSPMSPGQFYGGGTPGMGQGMGGMGMSMAGGMGMNMGMGGDAMGMGMTMGSPDPRRRMTRGMSGEDGFPGMHG